MYLVLVPNEMTFSKVYILDRFQRWLLKSVQEGSFFIASDTALQAPFAV